MLEKSYKHVLRMKNVYKSFGKVVALKGIDFEVEINEVVGLLGDNGAGKSTMVKIMTGVFPPTGGDMYIRNQKIDLKHYTVQTAHNLGIETVYQERSLGEKQPLWRNFFIGRQITNKFGFIKVKEEKKIARHIMLDLIGFRGAGVTEDSRVSLLSGGERQGVAIGRAMHFEADLIILDIKMKNMDGLDVLEELRAKTVGVPVILNSAYSTYKNNFTSWLADAYLVKSGDLSELKEKVKELLPV